jgi:thiamine-monophosphate kinase
MAADEFQLIERYFNRTLTDPDVVLGIGDDAAVLHVAGDLAVAVDTLVAGVHFPLAMPAAAVGHRALAVNLSDMAAMGAAPRWCTLALTLPEADETWLAGFTQGLFDLARVFQVSLVGGDLTRGPLTVSLQLLGSLAATGALTRGGARPGDALYVTGTLGDAAGGLALLQEVAVVGAQDPLLNRFLWPRPRVAAGMALTGMARACIDVSDGLLADLGHVCAASGCRGIIEMERLPLSEDLVARHGTDRARQLALSGGDDYELLFSAAAEHAAAELSVRLGVPVPRIGWLQPGAGTAVTLDGVPVTVGRGGYSHFSQNDG